MELIIIHISVSSKLTEYQWDWELYGVWLSVGGVQCSGEMQAVTCICFDHLPHGTSQETVIVGFCVHEKQYH